MKTLLQINTTCNWGSTGTIAEQIGRMAMARGWDSYIAYGRMSRPSQSRTIRIGSKADHYVHGALSRLLDMHGLCSERATKALVRRICHIRPDVVHLHNIHGYYLHYPTLFRCLAELDTRVVWTLHDCWPMTGHCPHFDYAGCDRWRTGCHHCPLLRSYPASWVADLSRRQYALKKQLFTSVRDLTVVAPSRWLARLAEQSILGCYPVRVINNGIDLDIFCPRTSDFRRRYALEGKKILLGVANVWERMKGLDVFVRLAQRFDDSHRIVLVGTDAKVDKLLPPNIISIHRTANQTELAQIYTAADVLVNPTRQESFSNVNLEARACGTPVVVFNAGGTPESAGPEGIVVDRDDVEGLVAGIQAALARGKYADSQRVGMAASLAFQKYIDLYEE